MNDIYTAFRAIKRGLAPDTFHWTKVVQPEQYASQA